MLSTPRQIGSFYPRFRGEHLNKKRVWNLNWKPPPIHHLGIWKKTVGIWEWSYLRFPIKTNPPKSLATIDPAIFRGMLQWNLRCLASCKKWWYRFPNKPMGWLPTFTWSLKGGVKWRNPPFKETPKYTHMIHEDDVILQYGIIIYLYTLFAK